MSDADTLVAHEAPKHGTGETENVAGGISTGLRRDALLEDTAIANGVIKDRSSEDRFRQVIGSHASKPADVRFDPSALREEMQRMESGRTEAAALTTSLAQDIAAGRTATIDPRQAAERTLAAMQERNPELGRLNSKEREQLLVELKEQFARELERAKLEQERIARERVEARARFEREAKELAAHAGESYAAESEKLRREGRPESENGALKEYQHRLTELQKRDNVELDPTLAAALDATFTESVSTQSHALRSARIEQFMKEADFYAGRDAEGKANEAFAAKFGKGPGGSGVDANRKISELLSGKYKDLDGLTEAEQKMLGERMQRSAKSAFEAQYNNLWHNELAWYQKAYHGVGDLISSAYDKAANIGRGVVNATKAVGNVIGEAVAGTGHLIASAASAVGSGMSRAWNWSNNLDNWRHLGSSIAEKTSAVWESVKSGAASAWQSLSSSASAALTWASKPQNWLDAGKALVTGIGSAIRGTYDFVTNPETWKALGRGIAAGASALWSGTCAVAEFARDCFTDPAKAWQKIKTAGIAIGHFAKELSNSIGLTDLAVGIYKLGEAQYRQLEGLAKTGYGLLSDIAQGKSTAEIKAHLKANLKETEEKVAKCYVESARALNGAVTLVGEFTGINDAVRCVQCVAKGDWKGAALYGTMAAVQIGGLILTAGGSNAAVTAGKAVAKQAAKEVLETAVKEGAEQLVKNVGKEVGEKIAEKLATKTGQELIEKTGGAIVKEGLEKMETKLVQMVKEGASPDAVMKLAKSTFSDVSEKQVEQLLKKAGMSEMLEKKVLEKLENASVKDIQERLVAKGMEKEAAEKTAKTFCKAVSEGGADEALKKGLSEQIKKEVMHELAEKPMQQLGGRTIYQTLESSVEKNLKRGLEELSEKLARKEGIVLDEAYKDAIKAGAKDGLKEGFERGVQKVVDEAVERAIKKHREREDQDNSAMRVQEREEARAKKRLEEDEKKLVMDFGRVRKGEELSRHVDGPVRLKKDDDLLPQYLDTEAKVERKKDVNPDEVFGFKSPSTSPQVRRSESASAVEHAAEQRDDVILKITPEGASTKSGRKVA